MPQITLTAEQTKVITESVQPVQICDTTGRILAVVPPVWSEEDIADAKRRLISSERRYTTAQVLEYLRSRADVSPPPQVKGESEAE